MASVREFYQLLEDNPNIISEVDGDVVADKALAAAKIDSGLDGSVSFEVFTKVERYSSDDSGNAIIELNVFSPAIDAGYFRIATLKNAGDFIAEWLNR